MPYASLYTQSTTRTMPVASPGRGGRKRGITTTQRSLLAVAKPRSCSTFWLTMPLKSAQRSRRRTSLTLPDATAKSIAVSPRAFSRKGSALCSSSSSTAASCLPATASWSAVPRALGDTTCGSAPAASSSRIMSTALRDAASMRHVMPDAPSSDDNSARRCSSGAAERAAASSSAWASETLPFWTAANSFWGRDWEPPITAASGTRSRSLWGGAPATVCMSAAASVRRGHRGARARVRGRARR
ncbi:MAG: hypothetical protein J3K34DRAFT_417702 [Monoraphidium minutum]|nr:MAG: hypothetical protein J3K34DRAFT_417702 [Monoraphidium minutum]